jgi:hypothetical protein
VDSSFAPSILMTAFYWSACRNPEDFEQKPQMESLKADRKKFLDDSSAAAITEVKEGLTGGNSALRCWPHNKGFDCIHIPDSVDIGIVEARYKTSIKKTMTGS